MHRPGQERINLSELSLRLQKGEEAVNNLYQQYTMLKNAIREMGGYEADEEID